MPNCIILEKFTCEVIRPNELYLRRSAPRNIGVLNAFSAFARELSLELLNPALR